MIANWSRGLRRTAAIRRRRLDSSTHTQVMNGGCWERAVRGVRGLRRTARRMDGDGWILPKRIKLV